ncbi:stage III sporulation protein AG [Clostridium sp. Ade.TY]|uniref:stage III sporulation protein AG n=1 Tax=Clostridium sp. Ade.TY TaxID=1391647 RepID=UPI000424C09B|nr:stage III sporulation protein AG [Clostridium sp. Ade.TY]
MDRKKIKEILGEFFKKKHINVLIVIIIIIVFLMTALNVIGSKSQNEKMKETISSDLEKEITNEKVNESKDEYELRQKEELTSILEDISGVGSVSVMMTFESGEVKIPAYNKDTQTSVTEENDSEGGKRVNEQKNDGSTVVMSTNDDGNEPFVIQTKKPKVIGVVVAAEGAENSKIKYEIQKMVSTLYDLSIDKVNVHPMKK